jgi:hypothetical protein
MDVENTSKQSFIEMYLAYIVPFTVLTALNVLLHATEHLNKVINATALSIKHGTLR